MPFYQIRAKPKYSRISLQTLQTAVTGGAVVKLYDTDW